MGVLARINSKKVCSELSRCQLEPLQYLKDLLQRSGLIYEHASQSARAKAIRIMRAATLLALVLYQLLYVAFYLVVKQGRNIERSLVVLCYLLQAFISMVFLVYWQRYGHLTLLAKTVPWENVKMSEDNALRLKYCKTYWTFWALFYVCIASLVFSTAIEFILGTSTHYDPNLQLAFGTYKLSWLSALISLYALYNWNVILTLYLVTSLIIHQELHNFNLTLEEIGAEEATRDEVADRLIERYAKHIELNKMIKAADHTFECYTFFQLGTNLPITVFSLLSFYHALSSTWYDIALSLPELLFCIVQITSLTLQPARIAAAVRSIESILYNNVRLWQPWNERVYSIASVFVRNASQGNLGYSIWSFAVINKSFFLTMVSLVLTYLTLIIQMSAPPSANRPNAA